LATFVGVRTNIPTIGIGKTLYCTDGFSLDIVNKGVNAKLVEYLEQQDFDVSMEVLSTEPWCIISRDPISPNEKSMNEGETGKEGGGHSMSDLIKAISAQCEGFAIPLKGVSGEVLAAVLVGHGGNITKKKQQGTKIPIYISVGHAISLQESICLCSALSLARIPEPVRQADLIGRELTKHQVKTNV
jgi:deoxyinosine 3'endonuclease (endonuclease V)